MATNTPITTIRISQELKDSLNDIAEREKRSLNNLINLALQEYVENHQAKDQHPQK